MSGLNISSVKIKKPSPTEVEDLNSLTKEELISKIKALTAHNVQLKNIIAKSTSTSTEKSIKQNKPYDFTKCTFRHILLQFCYLGWDYQGYAVQEDTTNTIEHYLFDALKKTCLIESREKSNYHRCGRTDKGVSSFGQVISLDIRSNLDIDNQHKIQDEIQYCSILNKVLPKDIRCIAWTPICNNFSARFNCKSRIYKYFFPKANLDVEKMKLASTYLVGTHDFRNLCKMDVGNGVVQFTRNILSVEFNLFDNAEDDEYDIYVVTIKGQAFLWHQIRCIMGILFLIGENKESPEIVRELLDVNVNPRKPDYNMASEVPLNLYECCYDYEGVNWQYNVDSVKDVLNQLRLQWTLYSIKSNMIKSMLNDLKEKLPPDEKGIRFNISDVLLQGIKRNKKNYIPVMERQKCDSLEEKIEHYAKRNRIEIKPSTNSC